MRENEQDIQFENDVSQEILPEQEIKLPTSPEIAQKGTESLKNVLDKLPPKLQQQLLKLNKCFLGIEPWISSRKPDNNTEGEQSQIDAAIDTDPNFQVVPYQEFKSNGELVEKRAMFNLVAVKNIMSNYPQFFDSKTINSPREWLSYWVKHDFDKIKAMSDPIARKSAAKIRSYQRGLLSGYPIWSVREFTEKKMEISLDKKIKKAYLYLSLPEFCQLDDEYVRSIAEIKAQSGLKEIIDSYSNV